MVWSLKSLGKGSFGGSGQSVLQFISLNTLVDIRRVPKAPTSGSILEKILRLIIIIIVNEKRRCRDAGP